ncbi:PREDICTED: LOB domain-containing protein 33-like [Camelina sativa]|uniref:LOB domain-containing protein 33-like n=1 Tax=Camelina sativa TaxID=90675 RepID=A0ABM0V8G2_CAMSA|nr:PREDICTED: LOB domain-containing protein 33-like [Camelina sativa]
MAGHGSSCGACKFLRRKCNRDCVFSPYFSYEEASSHFAAVHKVFGASNVSKHLLQLPLHQRSVAAITISYEALSRMRDPVYGCVAHIFALHQQVVTLQEEIDFLGSQMTNFSYSNQNGSQLNNVPEFVNQMTVDTTSFVDESLLNYNEEGRNCLDGFFTNSDETLVNHTWLPDMDYYYAPHN